MALSLLNQFVSLSTPFLNSFDWDFRTLIVNNGHLVEAKYVKKVQHLFSRLYQITMKDHRQWHVFGEWFREKLASDSNFNRKNMFIEEHIKLSNLRKYQSTCDPKAYNTSRKRLCLVDNYH